MVKHKGWRRRDPPGHRPVALSVAGSDSAGMAGIQMDGRVMHALGVHCATAVTAVTAQNSRALLATGAVDDASLRQQLRADRALGPVAVKAGALVSAGQIAVLADFIARSALPLVYDPVLASSSGARFLDSVAERAVLADLIPRCALVTPNLDETRRLTGCGTQTPAAVERAAAVLLQAGAGAVLIKGGHGDGESSRDFFSDGSRRFWLHSPRRTTVNTRGSGCVLSAAVTAALALGYTLEDAVVVGKMTINQGLRQSYDCGGQRGPLSVDRFPDDPEDLPALADSADAATRKPFPDCGPQPLGLYPVVDRAAWLQRLLPLGVTTIQLRIKNLAGEALRAEIETATAVAKKYRARLFVNDYWEQAIAAGAYGVHLGQEDLAAADFDRIRDAGLRLGISSHCHYEVARAHALRPSYIACGPAYHTDTKDMPWYTLGSDGLDYWRRVLRDYPVVAIGGINRERLPDVVATGVDGVAMITAITRAADPEHSCRELLEAIRRFSL